MGRIAVGMLVAAVVAAAFGYWSLKSYLHSDAFRKLLSTTVSRLVGMEGEFGPFRWDGLAVDTGSFEASGQGVMVSLHADRLRTEVNLSGVRRGVWDLHGATVNHLEVKLDARSPDGMAGATATSSPGFSPTLPAKPAKTGWFPTEVEVRDLDLRDVLVKALFKNGELRAEGMRVSLQHSGSHNSYRGEINGGRVTTPLPLLPEAELKRVRFRFRDGQVFITDVEAKVFESGRLEGSGEWNLPAQNYTFDGTVRDLKCSEIFNEDWSKRLTGKVASSVRLVKRDSGPASSGTLTITNGVLTALPVLDVLAAYADTRRFRILNLSEATTAWRWQDDQLTLSELILASEGLVRLEGTITVTDRVLDGRFRLGLAPGTLAAIPGAETEVFQPGERGLLWTPLAVSGTLDDPREDLTGRLRAAAGGRMFEIIPETGERVLKFTRSVLEDTRPIERGTEFIDRGTDILLREGTSILNGILGGRSPLPPPPPQPQPPPAPPQSPTPATEIPPR